jgi:nucleoid-associated protein YgaU
MPVPINSRYASLPIHDAPAPDGTTHPTIGLRPPPDPSGGPFKHRVVGGETIESIANRYLGSSDAWWRIADANPLVFPMDLTPGQMLVIPDGSSPRRVSRSRRL